MTEVVYNRIAMLRAERGVSRRALADALGVHYFEVPVEVVFATAPFPRLGAAEKTA